MAFEKYIQKMVFAPDNTVGAKTSEPSQVPGKTKADTQTITPEPLRQHTDGSPVAPVDNSMQNLADRVYQHTQDDNKQAVNAVAPSIQDRAKAGEDPYMLLLEKQYNDSAQDAERRRKAALLSDIAQLFGQVGGAVIGSRKFDPIQSSVPYYNKRLEQLRQQYDASKINYSLLKAREEQQRRAAMQQLATKSAYDRSNLLYKAGLDDRVNAAKAARDLDIYARRSGIDTEKQSKLQGIKHKDALAEIEARNKGTKEAAYIRSRAGDNNKVITIGDYDIAGRNWNDANINYVFSSIPKDIRSQYKGEPIYRDMGINVLGDGEDRYKIVGYKTISKDDMMRAIADNWDIAEVQSALGDIGAKKSQRANKNIPGFGSSQKQGKTVKGF